MLTAGQTKLVLAEVGLAEGGGGCGGYLARSVTTTAPQGSYIGGSAAKPTWSPVGGLVAYSTLQPGRMAVAVVSGRRAEGGCKGWAWRG